MAKRIQRKRTKGWIMPANTVAVTRPGKWGNPYRAGDAGVRNTREAVNMFRSYLLGNGQTATDLRAKIKAELGGKNLACFCKIGEPCHADVLLELANK